MIVLEVYLCHTDVFHFVNEVLTLAGTELGQAGTVSSQAPLGLKKVEVRVISGLTDYITVNDGVNEEKFQLHLPLWSPSWNATGILSGSVGDPVDYDIILDSRYRS